MGNWKTNLPVKTLYNLAAIYHLSLEEFLGGKIMTHMEKDKKSFSNLGIVGSGLILILLMIYLMPFKISADTISINGIPRNSSLDSSKTSYGKFHDRHDLGKIMVSGSKLRIKSTKPVTLWLLTNDQKTEKSYQINATEQVITASVNATPFITTPRDSSSVNVEYTFSGETPDLPIYQKNDDATSFINQWETSKAPFGLIKGKYFQLYLPLETLSKIKNMSNLSEGFKDLTDLENFYDNELFPLYNQLTGLSNNPNRFFLKADTHGAGGAYYGNNWTADSTSSGEMWLKNTWGVKHEIGHGFQNDLMRQMGMGEVSNNILGAYYDYHIKFNREADKKSWLFNYNNQVKIDKELSNQLNQGSLFSDLDLRQKLILIYTLFDRLGLEGISDINKAARNPQLGQLFATNSKNLYNYLSKIGQQHGLDFNKVMIDYGFTTNRETYFYQNEIFSNTSVLDSVNNLVDENNIEGVIDQVWANNEDKTTRTRFNLVTPKELSVTGLKSNVIVNFTNQLPEYLVGTEAALYDGEGKVASIKLDNTSSITFKDIPLGAYRIKFTSNKERLFVNNPYVISSQKGTVSRIKIEKYKKPTMLNYNTFEFKGLGDNDFMSINTTPSKSDNNVMIDVNFFSKNPHSYFSNEKYSGLTIESAGKTLFTKELLGNSTDLFRKVIEVSSSLEANTSVSTYHAEPSRLKVKNIIGDNIAENQKNNKFIFSNNGLINSSGNSGTTLEKMVITLGDSYLENTNYLYGNKLPNDFYWLIRLLPENKQTIYMEKYKDIVGKQQTQSITGSDFTMYVGDPEPTISDFKGSAIDKDGTASEVTVDLSKADLTKAGTYDVTLKSADGQSKVVKLTVKANGQSITGSDFSMYVGDKPPTVSDFKASATDKDGKASEVTVDLSKADLTKAGTYDVTLKSADGQSKVVKLTVKANPVPNKKLGVYRAYNPNSGEHLYTTSVYEYKDVLSKGWKAEGLRWFSPVTGIPVYRAYNPNSGEHFYTMSLYEYNQVTSKGWRKEGIGFYTDPNKGVPIYRNFNPNATGPGSHLYTQSNYEYNYLGKIGWRKEGIAFYGMK